MSGLFNPNGSGLQGCITKWVKRDLEIIRTQCVNPVLTLSCKLQKLTDSFQIWNIYDNVKCLILPSYTVKVISTPIAVRSNIHSHDIQPGVIHRSLTHLIVYHMVLMSLKLRKSSAINPLCHIVTLANGTREIWLLRAGGPWCVKIRIDVRNFIVIN